MNRTALSTLLLSACCHGVQTGSFKTWFAILTPMSCSALLWKLCACQGVCHEHCRCFRVLATFNSTHARSRATCASLENKRLSRIPALPHCVHCVHNCHTFGCILLIMSGCRYGIVIVTLSLTSMDSVITSDPRFRW